ncbi:hypothetical protein [Vibrio anguillarum]|uniref:hypothetical protein n=1 Tax=Vibrio anguillarum TaxID=55601 RepID=UPI003CF00A79
MSCTYVPESFKNNLRAALNALGTLKAVNYLIYHCQEDGQVKCEDRKMFEHFENLRAALTKMMIKNSPEYQAAQWGEFYDLDWHQRY